MNKIGEIIPHLKQNKQKGYLGRGGVIGGSFEYTGAPFYSALSLLKSGCDLSHIFCHKDAGIAIKSYSPEIIVHPCLLYDNNDQIRNSISNVQKWVNSLDSIIIGPGLGRDQILANYIEQLVQITKNKIQIFDADFFWYLSELNQNQKQRIQLYETIIQSPQKMIFTPNNQEFQRLYKQFLPQQELQDQSIIEKKINEISQEDWLFKKVDNQHLLVQDTQNLSNKFNNITILKKGQVDIITNGIDSYIVQSKSSLKRCGGQGDILAGCLATYAYWADQKDDILLGCVMASLVTREASNIAFQDKLYSLTAPDIIKMIGQSFNTIFEINK